MTRSVRFAAVACFLAGAASGAAAAPARTNNPADDPLMIPALDWVESPEWLNVKTKVEPKAAGDGKADDTAAIQAALSQMVFQGDTPKVIYLPPGTYRITRTLVIGKSVGAMLLGHGRDTRIVWDGPAARPDDKGGASRMFWSNGASDATYLGILWDGAKKAAVGFQHTAKENFECKVRHEHEAFVNCLDAGLQFGPQNPYATSESEVVDCAFLDCDRGLVLYDFNYYNEMALGCAFRNCRIAVHADRYAHVAVWNSLFRGSREVDIHLGGSYPHSVRGCVSEGSAQFFRGGAANLQSNRVTGWSGPNGAVRIQGWSPPSLIFDCVFARGPSDRPPIVFEGGTPAVISGNRGDGALFSGGRLLELPPPAKPPPQAFPLFRNTVRKPSSFLSLKPGGDATATLQAALDAAGKAGSDAVIWIPPRSFTISRTLQVRGSRFTLEGAGYYSMLEWGGPAGAPMLEVQDATEVTIRNLQFRSYGKRDMIAIRQVSTGAPSRVAYDRLYLPDNTSGWRDDQRSGVRGLELKGLGRNCHVDVGRINGPVGVVDSGEATIVTRFHDGGPFLIENPGQKGKTGTVGLLHANTYSVVVRNNADLAAIDLYCEQSKGAVIELSGSPKDPPGRATFGAARLHQWKEAPLLFGLDGYHGRFTYASAGVTFDNSPPSYLVVQKGVKPLDLLMLTLSDYKFTLQVQPSARVALVANNGVKDSVAPGAEGAVIAAIDHWRELYAAWGRICGAIAGPPEKRDRGQPAAGAAAQ
jgi:hypothetical protein